MTKARFIPIARDAPRWEVWTIQMPGEFWQLRFHGHIYEEAEKEWEMCVAKVLAIKRRKTKVFVGLYDDVKQKWVKEREIPKGEKP